MKADEMVQLIADAGGSMPFDEWTAAVRAGGGNPSLVQRLKANGQVHTTRAEGEKSIIRIGMKPEPVV